MIAFASLKLSLLLFCRVLRRVVRGGCFMRGASLVKSLHHESTTNWVGQEDLLYQAFAGRAWILGSYGRDDEGLVTRTGLHLFGRGFRGEVVVHFNIT